MRGDDPDRSTICTGTFELPLAPEHALRLFTPEGERSWVPGWAPRYPAPGTPSADPGRVFLTQGDRGDTTWVVTRASGSMMGYARVDPRGLVGTVEVACSEAGRGRTTVEVTYRLTALDRESGGELADFAAGFDAYLERWREALCAAIERGDA